MCDLLFQQAHHLGDATAYTYLKHGEVESATLSYNELLTKAMSVAINLQDRLQPTDRVLLLLPNGLDFIVAFFGCIFANVIAVPVQIPLTRKAKIDGLLHIAKDADVNAIVTNNDTFDKFVQLDDSHQLIRKIPCILMDEVDFSNHQSGELPRINESSIAFLQYTSGSTSQPKGVIVSHKNLLHNQLLIKKALACPEGGVVAGWLPMYHDMGLIGNMLQPLYVGGQLVFMSPTSFLQKPFRWLDMISRYRAQTSGGPNFAYDLCVDRVSDEQIKQLDLSCWTNAFNGAERVRAEVITRFSDKFKACGFDKKSFYPTYGLAEGTLLATGGRRGVGPVIVEVEKLTTDSQVVSFDTKHKKTQQLVSSGFAWADQEVIVVNGYDKQRCAEGTIGEIWLKGPSVTQGYWQNAEKTIESYQAYLADGKGPYFKTGDLGFLLDGQLYVTGRKKDLIILHGRNLYPEDIEIEVQQSYPGLKAGMGAAISMNVDGKECLVVLQEVTPREVKKIAVNTAMLSIKRAVSTQFSVMPYEVLLLKPGSIPRTTSGKIQRSKAKTMYENGDFAANTLHVNYCEVAV